MRVNLRYTFENYLMGRRLNIYLQEDGMYYVLETPLSLRLVTDGDIQEHFSLTLDKVREMVKL